MDAIALLEKQHKEVKALLGKVVETSGQEGAQLLQEITKNLLGHMIIEQEIFYPAAAKADLKEIDEGYEEHFIAREIINRAMQTKSDKNLFQARCKVLKELIEHHADEEEKEMFPTVKKALGQERLEALGAEMEPLFKSLEALPLPALARRAERTEVLADVKKPSGSAAHRKPMRAKKTSHGKKKAQRATRHTSSTKTKTKTRKA